MSDEIILDPIAYNGDKPALVAASAGCGKTYTLVKRVVHLLSHKELNVSADRLAIMTFTRKAAAEMKSRLDTAMDKLVRDNPRDDFLCEQQIKLTDAKISTIDSFCLSLLRDNIELLSLEPDFKSLDEVNAGIIRNKALKNTMLKIWRSEKNGGLFSEPEKADVFRFFKDERNLEETLLRFDSFISNVPDKTEWINRQLEIYGDEKAYEKTYLEPIKKAVVASLCAAHHELFSNIPAESNEFCNKVKAAFSDVCEKLKKMSEAIISGNHDFYLAAIGDGKLYPRVPYSKKDDYKELSGEIGEIWRRSKKLYEKALELSHLLFSTTDDRADGFVAVSLFVKIYEVFSTEYTELKRTENAIDFADGERLLLKLLRSEAGKKKELWRCFDYIIVDEFQDSNDLQFEIFKALSRNEKNLYFVGDIKQSIYAFRGANPNVFAGLLEDEKYVKLPLVKNFRSSDAVINSVNAVFCANMPKSFCAGTWEDMTTAREIKETELNKTESVLVLSDGAGEKHRKEAAYIADRIQRLVKEKFPVSDVEKKTQRPCNYGDFAILIKSDSGRISLMKDELEKRNIPVATRSERHFTDLEEINLAMMIFKLIASPFDDLALTNVLMSPLYMFTPNDMAKIRLLDGSEFSRKNDLHSNLTAALKATTDSELKAKINSFLSDFRLFRKLSREMTVAQLLRYIYENTDIMSLENVGYGGADRVANLRLLLSYAESFADTGKSTVSEFVSYMSQISAARLQMEQASVSGNENSSVKIVTIHSSKGLQYPIVFIAFSDTYPKSDNSSDMLFDVKTGIGLKFTNYELPLSAETAPHKVVAMSCDETAKSELLRVMYVAMTRAEEKLIITSSADTENDNEAVSFDDVSLSRFSLSLIPRLSGAFDASYKTTLISASEEISCVPDDKSEIAAKVIDRAKMEKNISYVYPYEKLTTVFAKATATQLGVIHDDNRSEKNDDAPDAMYLGLPSFMKNGRITPKQRGDIYHKAMEFLDFSAKNADAELSRLANEKILSSNEIEVINALDIQRFLDSNLCKRLNSAQEIKREFPIFTLVNAAGLENPDEVDKSFVQGIADMFFVENGDIVLVDYKTNRNVTAEELISEYKGQLEVYKKALFEMTGRKVKQCMLYSFSLGKEIPVETEDIA